MRRTAGAGPARLVRLLTSAAVLLCRGTVCRPCWCMHWHPLIWQLSSMQSQSSSAASACCQSCQRLGRHARGPCGRGSGAAAQLPAIHALLRNKRAAGSGGDGGSFRAAAAGAPLLASWPARQMALHGSRSETLMPAWLSCDGCRQQAMGLRRCSRCKQAQHCRCVQCTAAVGPVCRSARWPTLKSQACIWQSGISLQRLHVRWTGRSPMAKG